MKISPLVIIRPITIQCTRTGSRVPRRIGWANKAFIGLTKCQSGRSEGRQNSSADGGLEVELQFEEGIERTVRWYLENEEWLENVTSGEYQTYYNKM